MYDIVPVSVSDKSESNVVLNSTANVSSPLHNTWSATASTPTVGLTVITTSNGSPLQPLYSDWTV